MESKNGVESAKLIMPLFIDGNFNRDGKRMRAKHVKDISCDGGEYSLWISARGKENDYPRAENDTHYLYALAGEYLAPCGITEWKLEESAGYRRMVNDWYGSNEARSDYFDELRKGDGWHKNDAEITTRLKAEDEYIKLHRKDERAQAEYLKTNIEHSISQYINARDNGGKNADFVGAAFLGEVDRCEELMVVIRAERKAAREQREMEREEHQRQLDAEREKQEQDAIKTAEEIFKNGGKITSGEMIVKLADKHGVDIPIRTRGWIYDTFAECSVSNGSIGGVRFYKRKGASGSTRIWDILRDLQNVIVNGEWLNNLVNDIKKAEEPA